MKKNGYIDVIVETPVDGVKKGDKVYVIASEYPQLDYDAMVSCITEDDKTIMIPKRNLTLK